MAQLRRIFPPPPLESLERSSTRPRSPARSPVRSPKRRSRILTEEIDPLLDNLSPELFLNALSSINAVSNNEQHVKDLLFKTISSTSPEERALGARAAIAAQKLREWLHEVRGWMWPKEKDAQLGKGFEVPQPTGDVYEQKYWGSLPVHVVMQYEKRMEEIRDGIDGLDVESLKEYVLTAHIGSRSRPSSSHSTTSTVVVPLSYVQLRDFTAIITATILRALPTLTRLLMLLKTWDVRLMVLRHIPALLKALNMAKNTIQQSISALGDRSVESDETSSLEKFRVAKDRLEGLVLSAGCRMDRVLDLLDGREDSLPEGWIDTLDAVEAEFADWTVQAERRAIESELRRLAPRKTLTRNPSLIPSQFNEPASPKISPASKPMSQDVMPMVDVGRLKVTPESPIDCKETGGSFLNEQIASSYTSETKDVSTLDHGKSMIGSSPPVPTVRDQDNASKTNVSFRQTDDPRNTILPEEPDLRTPSPSQSSIQHVIIENDPLEKSQGDLTTKVLSREEELSTSIGTDSIVSQDPASEIIGFGVPETRMSVTGLTLETSSSNSPGELETVESIPSGIQIQVPLENLIMSAPLQEVPIPAKSAQHTTLELPATPSDRELFDANEVPVDRKKISIQLSIQPLVEETECSGKTEQSPTSFCIAVTPPPGPDSGTSHGQRQGNEDEILPRYTDDPAAPGIMETLQDGFEHKPTDILSDPSPHINVASRSSPVTKADSDHTLCEALPDEPPDQRSFYPTFRDEAQEASLPLQRFINEGLDAHFEMEEPLVDSGFLDRSFVRPSSVEDQLAFQVRQGSMSPPPEIAARPAIRSRSKASHIPSPTQINTAPKRQLVRSRKDNASTRMSATKKEIPVRQSSDQAKTSSSSPRTPLNQARLPMSFTVAHRLRDQPSIDSISSGGRNSEEGDENSLRFQDLSDGNVATISPFRDTDEDLHEKIHSILTSIPGRIRLKPVPAQDSDQQSVISSTSSLLRYNLRSKSSYSSLTRSGTPTPSITMAPAFSRTKNVHAHSTDNNAVRVYHLHHKGKTQPTKLFVRSVGPSGERVMVRVGGGWADLGEYLREYVHHHGRRVVSTEKVEVQGLPTPTSEALSPTNSITTLTPDTDRNPLPFRPGSVLSNRSSSSLAVRKTRRPSRPSGELPALTTANIETASSNHLSPLVNVSSRRPSISSVNSVSVSSTIGEYLNQTGLPYQQSGRTPSTPLGLAGPKPRSRQVSMTPESEAWVEDIVGQARKTSSLKPEPAQSQRPESRLEYQDISHSLRGTRRRNSNSRSVSDIGTGALNRRVLLRGLDSSGRRD